MTEKTGIDFDRRAFLTPEPPPKTPQGVYVGGLLLAFVAIAGLIFLGYKLLFETPNYSANNDVAAVTDLENRLATVESRLDKLEHSRKTAEQSATEVKKPSPKPVLRTVYQISPTPLSESRAPDAVPAADPATTLPVSAPQQGVGELQKNQGANEEGLQVTTDRLADVAGQVGAQGLEILRGQDELNELLSRTEMEAIPFELQHGSKAQPVGPVSLLLKSANPRTQRYTLCVYVQGSRIDLKDRTLNEVVQFVTSRNSTPLEVIATKIMKHEILGYLEIPRH
jgi:hypothetical protein